MNRSKLLPLLLLALLALTGCTRMRFVIDAVPADEELTESVVLDDGDRGRAFGGSTKIAMIDVTGTIMDAPRPGLIVKGENPVARFTEALSKARRDSNVRALIVRINSPGGTVTASDIVHRELKHFRSETGKPVIVLMGDVAASGGYYLACAGDEIIARPTTITGSIGVIMQTFNFSDGMQRIGIRADAIVSGPNKAVGSPFQPMPPEHRELLQNIVNEFYDNFVAIVTEHRPEVSPENLAWITDGRVVTGAKAVEIGLVDRLGDLRDAFTAAKVLAGVRSAKLIKYHRPMEHVGSPYATLPAPPALGSSASSGGAGAQINLLQLNLSGSPFADTVGFYYLWDPTVW